MNLRFSTACLALALALGCSRAAAPDPVVTKEPSLTPSPPPPASSTPVAAAAAEPPLAPEGAPIEPELAKELKEIFATYKQWGRVDDEFRWAPWLCRMPEPARPTMSRAQGGGHARKLYSLFAKDRAAYVNMKTAPAVGQVIVKESWIPEVVKDVAPDDRRGRFGSTSGDTQLFEDHFDRYRREGETLYHAKTLAGAYVMWKKPKATAGTDEGWAYGTITPDGTVTSAGRVSSCMGCHASAKHERLFGKVVSD